MEFKNGGERVAHNSGAAKPAHVSKKKVARKVVGISIAAVVIIALLLVSTLVILSKTGVIGPNAAIKKDDYQAVFLTNGQVYFGKLQNAEGDYLKLTNIYYLQVDSSIQAGATQEEQAQAAAAAANDSNVQLIKLGNELHGPQDEMQISSEQVLFWENLKGDSRVSQAIADYRSEE